MDLNKIINGDALTELKMLPDQCVHCVVTSPPYYGLRDYGMEGQSGMEDTPEEFIAGMVEIFREVRRILKENGTLWLNIGDSYSSGGRKTRDQDAKNPDKPQSFRPPDSKGIKPKDLLGIPWMLAFALRADGWYLRQDIIWSKPNPMPESVTDRCTKSHEYLFLLSKSPKYHYDAFSIKTPYQDKTFSTFGCSSKGNGDGSGLIQSENWGNSIETRKPKIWKTPDGWDTGQGSHGTFHKNGREKGNKDKHLWDKLSKEEKMSMGANKRSVWSVASMPFKEAHFATFPPDLIVDCIKAGCPEKGIVLDPFMGAGTTALVARKLNRNYLGIELNPEYIKIAETRLHKELGFFAEDPDLYFSPE